MHLTGRTPSPRRRLHSPPQANRQSEPHAHAIVLEPYFGKIAFVPDLGMVGNPE